MTIDPQLKSSAQQAADHLMREVKGVKAVVISTEDGFEVAACVQNDTQTSRLSAMASSFSALGALVGEESQLGSCNNVIVDAAEGLIVILQIRNPGLTLTMCVVTGRDSVIGQVLYFSKQAAEQISAGTAL
jgi:uncharacterized protein